MRKWDFYTAQEIKPRGWLRRQLEIQAEGLSGHLHKIWPDIRDSAWIGGSREGWERVPYWLDGFIPLAYLLENETLIAVCKTYIDAILAKQEADGWLCPCKKRQRARYDTWALQLITKTLTVYYECSGDERIPDVLYRALKNYYDLLNDGTVHLFGWGKFRWFETFFALRLLKTRYDEEWITDLARILKAQGYDYDRATALWKTPHRLWRFKTHIVNIAMMLKAEAVSCELLNEVYTDKAETYRQILDACNGTVFEGFTGDECLSGVSPIQGTELCAVVEQMYSYEQLFAYTGDNGWAQRLEVLAFNALPATLSEDMRSHQYDQMVNQIACQKLLGLPHFGTNGPRAHLFGLEPNFGCCTANFSQGFPKLALSAFMHKGDTVINALMLPSRLDTGDISIMLDTDYPFENRARYRIRAEKPFRFVIRIPAFAQNLRINGEAADTKDVVLSVKPGETEAVITFDTPIRLKARPNSQYTAQKGSLLFSVPIPYTAKRIEYTRRGVERKYPYCDFELIPSEERFYGFCDDAFSAAFHGVGAHPFSESQPPVTVTATMQRIHWGTHPLHKTVCAKAPKSVFPLSAPEAVTLIPYGCAKLRMTEMPFVQK